MLVIRSRRCRRHHIHLKTSLNFPAQNRHSQLHWNLSIQTVLLASLSIASWIGKETLLIPTKIHRLEIQQLLNESVIAALTTPHAYLYAAL